MEIEISRPDLVVTPYMRQLSQLNQIINNIKVKLLDFNVKFGYNLKLPNAHKLNP